MAKPALDNLMEKLSMDENPYRRRRHQNDRRQ